MPFAEDLQTMFDGIDHAKLVIEVVTVAFSRSFHGRVPSISLWLRVYR